MKSGLAFGLGIFTGAGAALAVAHFVLKQQYEQKADEQIAACREAFLAESAKMRETLNEKKAEERKTEAVSAMQKYGIEKEKAEAVINRPDASEKKERSGKRPYVIDPAVYDRTADSDKSIGLKYYPSEGVLTGDDDKPIGPDEMEELIGRDALNHFGDFGEDDRVCVRDEVKGLYYEICVQPRKYADVLKEKPYLKK